MTEETRGTEAYYHGPRLTRRVFIYFSMGKVEK
jgi:hypothetical protein